ncbi:Gamma-aminobutyric acid type B receptor subunit 2, partial [Lamellibrachia satsuma]
GGRPPPDADILITNTLKMDKVMFWWATCLASLGVVFCTVCVAFNVYYTLFLIFGIFFAWETRKVSVEVLNDSKEIGICVYNIMIMSVVSFPIYRLLPLQQMDVSFGVISISVFVCAVTTLLLVFGPKMQLVATGGQRVDDCAVLPFASSINQKKRTAAGGTSTTVEDCPGPSTSSRC